MTLTIGDDSMSSGHSPHTARLAPGAGHQWEVSWLPGRQLNRNEAITAMVLADVTGSGQSESGRPSRAHVEGWAAELNLTTARALQRLAGPPRWAAPRQRGGTLADPEAGG